MKLRSGWHEQENEAAGLDALTPDHGESMTQMQFAKDADLNEIVRRMGVTERAILPAAPDAGYFGDFSEAPRDLSEAMELVDLAQARFRELPPKLRAQFDNDPRRLWAFVNDPANLKQAVELGLLASAEAPPSSAATAKGAEAPPAA